MMRRLVELWIAGRLGRSVNHISDFLARWLFDVLLSPLAITRKVIENVQICLRGKSCLLQTLLVGRKCDRVCGGKVVRRPSRKTRNPREVCYSAVCCFEISPLIRGIYTAQLLRLAALMEEKRRNLDSVRESRVFARQQQIGCRLIRSKLSKEDVSRWRARKFSDFINFIHSTSEYWRFFRRHG